ncbi:asparagine synthase-related protein [Granulicella sp. WH15]|uniref:asparagine synthetase B family protein n=1 Tax=Granulicella sp. WH15 TaxID=2602070 RepID=UPI0013A5A453|nr:asparagine synthase-related protein [Granulicella sp. WH15]
MSIIFGLKRNDNEHVDEAQLMALSMATSRYAADGTSVRGGSRIGMGFQPYHTHQRSHLEHGPMVDDSGNIVTLDGRLDNHVELSSELGLDNYVSDSTLILAAFERWGEQCFSRLIGDWAISLWSRHEDSLYLARDHAGTRSLYYEQSDKGLLWSTFLETFHADGFSRQLDEGYMARYLACQPLCGRTPYSGVFLVPAAHYLKFRDRQSSSMAHWQWMAKEEIHYNNDKEYENHFFDLFRQSVKRRIGSGAPILAELSGGMDSSSIVCMADHIRRSDDPNDTDLLDTISYYDDREPEIDELPFVHAVETLRGKAGVHMEASYVERTFDSVPPSDGCYLLPGADSSWPLRERRLIEAIGTDKHKVILSGTGGDEVMGGVPNPLPELGDYMITGRIPTLLAKSTLWCLPKRLPLLLMIADVFAYLAQLYRPQKLNTELLPPWMNAGSLTTDGTMLSHETPFLPPSRIENGRTWWIIQETLPHLYPSYRRRWEYRYPFLDRDVDDFLFRIPREQLLRPRHKRSLQRRSLSSLLPAEVLNRSRKAYAVRGISLALQDVSEKLTEILDHSVAVQKKIVKRETYISQFRDCANGIGQGNVVGLMRLLLFESWIRNSSVKCV